MLYSKKWIFVVVLLLGGYGKLWAQLSLNDSLFFQSVFTAGTYVDSIGKNLVGTWFTDPPISSRSGLDSELNNQFKFKTPNLHIAYDSVEFGGGIQADSALTATFGFYHPTFADGLFDDNVSVVSLDFTLNNITGRAYAYKNAQADNEIPSTAYVIIPGSGNNQSAQIVRGQGYHSLYCNIRDVLDNKGDVYTYCKPNEDFRAIRWNNHKLNGGGPGMIYDFTDSTQNYYCISYLIECVALVKKLKQTYSKVVVLGLSQGGEAALIVSLLANPDAAVISAGYSIQFDTYYPLYNPDTKSGNIYFDDFLTWFSMDSVRSKLGQSSTRYLFSYGRNDYGWCCGAHEEAFKTTEAFLNGLSNVSFYYNFNDHAFPCTAIDTFTHSVMAEPKCVIKLDTSICTLDSAHLQVYMNGVYPVQAVLYRNDSAMTTVQFNQFFTSIKLEQEGVYAIRDIMDAKGFAATNSTSVQYIADKAVTLSEPLVQYSCVSDSLTLSFALSGTAPWQLSYLVNDTVKSVEMNADNQQLVWPNANYTFTQVEDKKGCTAALHYQISSVPQVNAVIGNTYYHCETTQSTVELTLSGSAPWTLSLQKDSDLFEVVLRENQSKLLLTNALYYFVEIKDSNGCELFLNESLELAEPIVSGSLEKVSYTCSTHRAALLMHSTGAYPIVLNCRKNGEVLTTKHTITNAQEFISLENGTYQFEMIDSRGCSVQLDTLLQIQFDSLSVEGTIQRYDCTTQTGVVGLTLTGNQPFEVTITNNGVIKQLHLDTNQVNFSFPLGAFSVTHIIDSTGCELHEGFGLKNDTLATMELNNLYVQNDSIYTKHEGIGYVWYINHQKVDSTVLPAIVWRGNGYYSVEVYTDTQCKYILPAQLIIQSVGISTSVQQEKIRVFPNPFSNQLEVILANMGNEVQGTFTNMFGQTIKQVTLYPGSNILNVKDLPDGVYFLKMNNLNGRGHYPIQKILKVNGQ